MKDGQYGAHKYFDEAKEFSDWVNNTLDWVTQEYAVDEYGNKIDFEELEKEAQKNKSYENVDELIKDIEKE